MQVRKPEIVGHRGHGSEPENTMRAFQAGRAHGAERIELDIQSNADGDFVVIHDPTVERTTNGEGKVRDLTTAQIQALDAGKGERVPLFKDILEWASQQEVPLTIEMKHPKKGEEKLLADMVRGAELKDPWVISFKADFVEKFEACAPEVKTGVLVHERPLFNHAMVGAGVGLVGGLGLALTAGLSALPFVGVVGAQALAGAYAGFRLSKSALQRKDLDREVDMHIPGRRILSPKTVKRAQERGKEVGVYTVDDAKKARKFTQWGVDAIITNYPEKILTASGK